MPIQAPRYQPPVGGIRTQTDFIGPEGARLSNFRVQNGRSIGALLPDMSDEDLQRQISVAGDIEAQRGLNPDEAQNYANLKAEFDARNQRRAGADQSVIKDIFGSNPNVAQSAMGGQPTVPQFDPNAAIQDVQNSAAAQRAAIGDVFNRGIQSGGQAISDLYNPLRGRAIDEEGALGSRVLSAISRSPDSAISQIDTGRQNAIRDLVSGLAGKRAESEASLEQNLGNQMQRAREFGTTAGLQGGELGLRERLGFGDIGLRQKLGEANLLQGGQQFGQTFGLQQQRFAEEKRQNALANLREQQRQEAALELGRLQAKNAEPGIFSQIGQVVGGIGSLAGGFGGLAGGLGALKTANTLSNYTSDMINNSAAQARNNTYQKSVKEDYDKVGQLLNRNFQQNIAKNTLKQQEPIRPQLTFTPRTF